MAQFLENCLSSIRLQEAAAAGPGPAANLPLAGEPHHQQAFAPLVSVVEDVADHLLKLLVVKLLTTRGG